MKKFNEIYEKVNDYWNKLWEKTDTNWRKIKKWKYWEVLLVLFLTSSLILILIFFNSLSSFLFTSENRNGELVKIVLSIIGGFGLFYGLWINSKRIKEQSRQNNISENRNNDQRSYDADKRFGEAIGYLGSGNTTIVLGGIYALHQLATEDNRYISIVAGLFTSFIKDKSKLLYEKIKLEVSDTESKNESKIPIEISTIINLLFLYSDIYKGIQFDLSFSYLKNIIFYDEIKNCIFSNSTLINCEFRSDVSGTFFDNCKIINCNIGSNKSNATNCTFYHAKFDNSKFTGKKIENCNFMSTEFTNSIFYEIAVLNECQFIITSIIDQLYFCSIKSITNVAISKNIKSKLKISLCPDKGKIIYL